MLGERRATRGVPTRERIISWAPQSRRAHIDVAGPLRQLRRVVRGAAFHPVRPGAGRVVVAIVVSGSLLGCGGGGDGDVSAPEQPTSPLPPRDPSGSPAASLRAGLTAQLEARVHLLAAQGAAAAGGDDDEAAGAEEALDERRDAMEAALTVGDASGVDDLLEVLADQDDLLRDHATAETATEVRGARTGLSLSAERLAVVAESMTGGRLPADVAAPLADSHLTALLAIDDARQEGGAAGAAVALGESLASCGRLLEPLLLALTAEVGLEGAPVGDATLLRADLASMLVQHGFGAAEAALGIEGGEELVVGAADRLSASVAASYGDEVAVGVRARWSDQVGTTGEVVLAAVALRQASGPSRREAARRSADLAEDRSDDAIGAVADLLAETMGDDAVGHAVRTSLRDHRLALVALVVAAEGGPAVSWPLVADAALELSDLSATLASAVTRQKSLG